MTMLMNDAIHITIPDTRAPGWNAIMRMHWTKQDKLNNEMWLTARAAMGDADWQELDYRVDVHVKATFKGTPLDSDNICIKFIVDSLKTKKDKKTGEIVERRILQEDDPRWVRRVTGESVRGKRNFIEITLTEVAE